MNRLTLNIKGIGISDRLPIDDDDFIVEMRREQIDGEEWLFLRTYNNRQFHAQANDAGGLNVKELA